jgi:hypothetical protein
MRGTRGSACEPLGVLAGSMTGMGLPSILAYAYMDARRGVRVSLTWSAALCKYASSQRIGPFSMPPAYISLLSEYYDCTPHGVQRVSYLQFAQTRVLTGSLGMYSLIQ